MKYFDFSLPAPAENLACDEALLDLCERELEDEILRFWEPETVFVVMGYANQAAQEVNLDACEREAIPVLRRCSGGGTVVQGPGCLNYSLVLRIDGNQLPPPALPTVTNPLRSIAGTNKFILERQLAAVRTLVKDEVGMRGQTDLVVGDRKFSGNAQRRLKNCLIFHGTFLLGLHISLIEKLLPMPSKQPCYRADRRHADFLVNLKISPEDLKRALRELWGAEENLKAAPINKIGELMAEKYGTQEWNLKF